MQNTSTSRSTDFRRQKTITSKTPLTLYGRGFCASDRTPTTTGSPAGSQSNQNVWVFGIGLHVKPRLHAWHSHRQSRSHFTFSSLSDQEEIRLFSFFETLFHTKLPFPLPWWSKDLLVENLQVGAGRSTSKSTCVVPTWNLTAFGDWSASSLSKQRPAWTLISAMFPFGSKSVTLSM